MITKEQKLRIELSEAQKYVCHDLLGSKSTDEAGRPRRPLQAPEGTAEETFQRCGVRLRIRSMGSLYGNPKGQGSGVHEMGVGELDLLKYQEWIRPGGTCSASAGDCFDWDPYRVSDSTPPLEGEAAVASIKQEDELGLRLKGLQRPNKGLNEELNAARRTLNSSASSTEARELAMAAFRRLTAEIQQLATRMKTVDAKREELRQRRQFGVEGKRSVNPDDPKLQEIRNDCRRATTGGRKAHQNVRDAINCMPLVPV